MANPPPKNPSGITAPTGKDMTTAGVGETAFADQGGAYLQPGEGKQLYDQTKGAFTKPGVGEQVGGDVAQDLLKGSQGSTYGTDYWEGVAGSGNSKDPGMIDAAWKNMQSVDANMDPYYDLAFQDTERQLNRASAARGRFNSTEAMRDVGEASTRLNAQQAKDEAHYKLDRAEKMGNLAVSGTAGKAGWQTSMGDLAFRAGTEKREYGEAAARVASQAQDDEMKRMSTGIAAALGIDADQLASLEGYMGAARDAQTLRENRVTGGLDRTLKMGELIAAKYGTANTTDTGKGEDQAETIVASAEDKRRQEEAEQKARELEMAEATAILQESYGGGSSGGTGGTSTQVR
jgi:hypothetical protein